MASTIGMQLKHVLGIWRRDGTASLLRRVGRYLRRRTGSYSQGFYDYGYQDWIKVREKPLRNVAPPQDGPQISVLVPVYNVEERWLSAMIESVIGQSYPHWQLCLVNDCAGDAHVKPLLDRYAAGDSRIAVKHLDSNAGIAAASNHALEMAGGDYVALLDHDDELAPHALAVLCQTIADAGGADLIYSDEDKIDAGGKRQSPFFKPDYSPQLLACQNYFGHLVVARRQLVQQVGGFRQGFDGAQDYDLVLRLSMVAESILHIPMVLYHWRRIPGSTAAVFGEKDYAWNAGRSALQDYLNQQATGAKAHKGSVPGTYRAVYPIRVTPTVSVIIPFRDQLELLEQCLASMVASTDWSRMEIIAIDNQSRDPSLDAFRARWCTEDPRIRFIQHDQPFNFSAICNAGVDQARGEYIVLMNNDIEVRSLKWLENMLRYAALPDAGAVGAMLRYPDETIQHAGIVTGISGSAGHPFKGFDSEQIGYYGRLRITSNVSAVTAALLMVSRQKYLDVGGLDADQFGIAMNDVDFCLKLGAAGYRNIVTADVEAIHHESVSRGSDQGGANRSRYLAEVEAFKAKWSEHLAAGDPFYNCNLSLESEDYRLGGV